MSTYAPYTPPTGTETLPHTARRLHTAVIPLALIVILAAGLRLYNLTAIGDGNTYYTAAVTAMLQSPSNFFFAAAEPGGSVTVDKPPLGLWLQTISAAIFGVSGISVVLPQVIAGVLSVLVMYLILRRTYSVGAGLIGAAVLAVSPISIAVDRNNTMDSTLILCLLLAAWAFMKAVEAKGIGWLLAGVVFVGLGFNIKMLQAFLPLPAFYLAYLLAAKASLLKKIGGLSAATVVLAAVALSWALIVQIAPADQRPYIGGSENNSVFDLIFGYNGVERLSGAAQPDGSASGAAGAGGNQLPPPPASQGGAAGYPMQSETGEPGLLRLFTGELSNEIAWLLPFALAATVAGGAALLLGLRRQPLFSISTELAGVVLWGGWLVICLVFFSVARFFHAYYMATMIPAIAAMTGIGVHQVWKLGRTRWAISTAMLMAVAAATLIEQVIIANGHGGIVWWLIPAFVLLITAGVLMIANRRGGSSIVIAYGAAAGAMVIAPLVWSVYTTTDPNPNIPLPAAYEGAQEQANPALGGAMPGMGAGRLQGFDQQLITYLRDRTANARYMLAVPNALLGSSIVIETGRGVMYLGGFNGQDQIVTPDQFAANVSAGEVRYVFDAGILQGQQPELAIWISIHCTVDPNFRPNINGAELPGLPSGAPSDTQPPAGFQPPPGMQRPSGQANTQPLPPNGIGGSSTMQLGQPTLYDCGATS